MLNLTGKAVCRLSSRTHRILPLWVSPKADDASYSGAARVNRTVARLFRITFVYFQGRIAFPRDVDDRNGNFGNGWSPLVTRVPGWELYSSFLSLLGELASIVGARTAKLCIHTCWMQASAGFDIRAGRKHGCFRPGMIRCRPKRVAKNPSSAAKGLCSRAARSRRCP